MFNKANFVVVLYYISLLVLLVGFFELTLVVWMIVFLLTWQGRYSLKILTLLLVLGILFFCSAISTFFYDYEFFNILRDIAYIIKPVLGLILGYNITKALGERTLNHTINIGVLVAFLHILIILFGYFITGIRDLHALRAIGGYYNDFEVFVLILVVFKNQFNVKLSTKQFVFYLIIISTSLLLYFSRANFIQFALLCISILGYLRLTPKSLRIVAISAFFIIIGYTILWQINPKRNGEGIEAFLYKVKIAPIEPFKTKINVNDYKEFNDNFRSYENLMTVRQVFNEGYRSVFFGSGLGSTVNYGRDMLTTEGTYVKHAPALHNAYATMFLKAGLLGVLLLNVFIVFMPIREKTSNVLLNNYKRLIFGSAIFMVLSNWVFMGLFLKFDNKSIFFGFAYAYYEFLKAKSKEKIDN
jgi:hypothetical protein